MSRPRSCAWAAAWTIASLATAATAHADVKVCLETAERAQPLRASGELRRARNQLIICSADTCPRAIRADCMRWLAEVEGAMPRVVVQARDPNGADIVDVTVSIDGVVQQRRLDGLAIPVDPGTRVFRFESPGREPSEQTLAVREGEKQRTIPVVMMRPGERKSDPSAPAPLFVPAPDPHRDGVSPAVWALGGAGLLVVGGGAILWAQGVSERNELRNQCASAASCARSDIDAARTKLVVGDVLVGVGAVSVALSVWLGLRAGARPSPTSFVVTPGGAALLHSF